MVNASDNITPPKAPTSIAGLMEEMYGVYDSQPALYQGMIRYWLMWRLPQIISYINSAPGIKFHLCGTYQGLLNNFIQTFMMPDLLTVGQCGHVLQYEMLQYEHSFDRPWPNVDGTQPGLGAIGSKVDRPIVDGVIQYLCEWIRPLSSSGNVLFAPFTTMLAPQKFDIISYEYVIELLKKAITLSKTDGLPGITIKDRMEFAKKIFEENSDLKSIPLNSIIDSKVDKQPETNSLTDMELKYGRYYKPGSNISVPDSSWSPSEILAFEFLIANELGNMLVVVGDWCNFVPSSGHNLNIRLPYVDGISTPLLAKAISDDPALYNNFRETISNALLEARKYRGSESFDRELNRIQKDIIDAGIAKLNKKWKTLKKMRAFRFADYAVQTLGITIGLYIAYSPLALVGLFGNPIRTLIKEKLKRLGEKEGLEENPMYFIWKIGQ